MIISETQNPLSAVIIGGSLSGMSAAIEANLQGFNVTVIEKRSTFSRPQWLFLTDTSIKLLEKWGVEIKNIRMGVLDNGDRMGFIAINDLEGLLHERVSSLGIQIIHAQFQGFAADRNAVQIATDNDPLSRTILELPYDVVVAADGANSNARESLGIERKILGLATGASALIPLEAGVSEEVEISESIQIEEGFIRRIKTPRASIVIFQTSFNASYSDLMQAVALQGWNKEAEQMKKRRALVIENVPIALSQATDFTNCSRSAIVIGDAAATASFFKGQGANTAFKCAKAAGGFFEAFKSGHLNSFKNFNEEVRNITDAMIENSAFLFSDPTADTETAV